MTVQSIPRPTMTRSPLLAALLLGGLAAGFVAGQAVPTVIDLDVRQASAERAGGFSLGRLDDYGIRAGTGALPAAATVAEAQRDDWGLRHPSAAQTGARSQDDYGLRHSR